MFGGLFRRAEKTAEVEEAKETLIEEGPTSSCYVDMIMDVLDDSRSTLFSGKVISFTEDSITLGRLVGTLSFPVYEVGADIILRGYDKSMAPVNILGHVGKSMHTSLEIVGVSLVPYEEQRSEYRLPVNIESTLKGDGGGGKSSSFNCTLVNVSVNGACVLTSDVMTLGEVVHLQLKFADNELPVNLKAEVIREGAMIRGKHEYGLLFAQMDDAQQANLAGSMFRAQALLQKRAKL